MERILYSTAFLAARVPRRLYEKLEALRQDIDSMKMHVEGVMTDMEISFLGRMRSMRRGVFFHS
jgi:hypothetical protein